MLHLQLLPLSMLIQIRFIPNSNIQDPDLYQIFIHWKPDYAPFPITVRADMTINDVLHPLSALLQINQIYLFLFYEYRMQHLRRRLDDRPTIGPGTTLQLQRWSLQQAREWSNEWRCLWASPKIRYHE